MLAASLMFVSTAAATYKPVAELSVKPKLAVTSPAGIEGLPGQTVPAPFVVTNTGSSLGLSGSLDFTAPALKWSRISGWWVAVEARGANGVWNALSTYSSLSPGYTFGQAPPAANDSNLTAEPDWALGVTYPSSGDLVAGTIVSSLLTARWSFDLSSIFSPAEATAFAAAARDQDVRLRWRFESRDTNLFGQVSNGSSTGSVSFRDMARSQSVDATGVRLTATGDGQTQVFDVSNNPGLAAIVPGQGVPVATTAKIAAVSERGSSETETAYLQRLVDSESSSSLTAQTSFATANNAVAVWWWLSPNNPPFEIGPSLSDTAAPAATSVKRVLPILSLTKSGPTEVLRGDQVVYTFDSSNSGHASGNPVLTDAVNGGDPAAVHLATSMAVGQDATGHHVVQIPANYSGSTISDIGTLRWSDSAGNQYGPISASFTSSIPAPDDVPVITSAPDQLTRFSDAVFEFTSESDGLECQIDDADWVACEGQFSAAGLSDGERIFRVRYAEVPNLTASHTWMIDTAPPVAPVITDSPNQVSGSTAATFEFTGEAGAAIECSLDGESFEPCGSPKSFEGLSVGLHEFQVRATDPAGNVGDATSFEWEIDLINNECRPEVTESRVLNIDEGGGQ